VPRALAITLVLPKKMLEGNRLVSGVEYGHTGSGDVVEV